MTDKYQDMIEGLWLREDDDLLFIASIIRLILDEREVYYPSRESKIGYKGGSNDSNT